MEKNKKEKTSISTIIPNQGSWITLKLNLRFRINYFSKEHGLNKVKKIMTILKS